MKKILRIAGPFLLFFVTPLLIVFWSMGGFAPAKISFVERGPYAFAYMENQGDLGKLIDIQDEVYKKLQADSITAGAPITLLLNDPQQTKRSQRLAQTGYLIPAGTVVRTPLKTAALPKRKVLLVEVKASPLIAPGKAYKAMLDYLAEHRMPFRLPTVEIYQGGVFHLEMAI